jgi:RNA 2',3'-cyclic 3'-phosphodiesterase
LSAGPVAATARLFFALVPDSATRRRILACRRTAGLTGRPVPAARLHVTLAFLGSQPRDRLGELRALAGQMDFPVTRVVLDRIGGFEPAGVAWLGAARLPRRLVAFRTRLVERLADAGFGFDRKPWIFHLTLYRDLRTPPGTMHCDPVIWNVNGFALMESVSGPQGLQYRALGHWPAPAVSECRKSPR